MSVFGWMWIPEFPVWVAERALPALRGQPVVVHRNGRAIARSETAQQRGIGADWTVARAQSLVPQVLAVPYDAAACAHAWEQVLDELWQLTPRLEENNTHDKGQSYPQGRVCFEVPTRRAERHQLLQLVTGWEAHCGVATNRALAELASCVSMSGRVELVKSGGETAFVRNVPISALAHAGVSAATIERLQWFGLWTVARLRVLLRDQLIAQFPEGALLARFAHAGFAAREVRPVAAYRPLPRSEARHVFEHPATEPSEWNGALEELLSHTIRELNVNGQGAGVLWIDVTLRGQSEFKHTSRILREPVTAARALWEPAQALLHKLLPNADDALREVLAHLEKRCPQSVLRLHERDPHAVLCEERFSYIPALPLPSNHTTQVLAAPFARNSLARDSIARNIRVHNHRIAQSYEPARSLQALAEAWPKPCAPSPEPCVRVSRPSTLSSKRR